MSGTQRIASLALDEKNTLAHEHEWRVAVSDLVEWNHFALKNMSGPYAVKIGTCENRITFSITSGQAESPASLTLALSPFRTLMRDYFLICESYKEAVRGGNLSRIEAIDMSRRGLHNEGSELLTTLLKDKVEMDFETARRLFTLIGVLHMK